MKKVAVVTVNYNTQEATSTLLRSLDKVKTPDFSLEIIVIDNGSEKPLTIEKKPNTIQTNLDKNIGFTGGYNIGIKKALASGADYILIINNDTIVDQDFIIELLQVLESDQNIGVTVPKIYFAKGHEFHKDRYEKHDLGKVLWYAGGFIDFANAKSVHTGVDEVDKGQYDKDQRVDFATGCCMLFKKEVLEKVGLFDEQYFLYYEDADISMRIKKAGFSIFYAPKAIIYHYNASSSGGPGRGNELQDYFLTRNQMLFGMKYAPLRSKLALLRQSFRLLTSGRTKQKQAIRDFYLGNFAKGSFKND